MPSTLRLDRWQNTAGVQYNVPVTVVTQTYNTQVSTTSTSFVDLFGATIVPKGNDSDFYVETVISWSDMGRGYSSNQCETKFRLINNSTGLTIGSSISAGSSYTGANGDWWWGWDAEYSYNQFSDEQNAYNIKNTEHIAKFSGSRAGVPIGIMLQWKVNSSTAFLNRCYQSTGSGSGVSTIRIMEILR